MKNALIAILGIITIVVGYVAATSTLRMSMAALQGKTATVRRGDLTLPINATGEVRPLRRVEIKSEASGEVIEIAKRPGERVSIDDLLIRLQRDDEERNVRRAELNVQSMQAALDDAWSALKQAEGPDLDSAQANAAQIDANLKYTKMWADRVTEQAGNYTEDERVQRTSRYESELAQLDGANAAVARAEIAIPRAGYAVKRAEANLKTAENNRADAQKQLNKTDISSPIDGIVSVVTTQIGEVIQGGKQNLTGGTILAVLLDMETLILQAEVDEADIGRLLDLAPAWARPGRDADERMPEDVGQIARKYICGIGVETFPDAKFDGVIERIYPESRTVQNVTTYLVDVVIIGENRGKLLPGMRGEASFTSEHVENAVLCPNEAIHTGPNGTFGVYVPDSTVEPGEAPERFVECKIGLSDGAFTEIREGFEEGTVVFVKRPAVPQRSKR